MVYYTKVLLKCYLLNIFFHTKYRIMNTSNIIFVDIAPVQLEDAEKLCSSLVFHDDKKLWSMTKDDCEKFMEFTENQE